MSASLTATLLGALWLSAGAALADHHHRDCGDLTGHWSWDARRFPATIFPDGSIQAFDLGQQISARWTCVDPESRTIQVHWSTNIIDTLTLSSDSQVLSGGNNGGAHFSVLRRGSLGSRCEAAAGNWLWDTRQFPATIYDNGDVTGYDFGQTITARWTCLNPRFGDIIVYWSTGAVDSLSITYGEDVLDGWNNGGAHIMVQRN